MEVTKDVYVKTYSQLYYEKNKDKITSYKKCETCGGKYTQNTKTNHLKSKKHKTGEMESKVHQLECESGILKVKSQQLESQLNNIVIVDELKAKVHELESKLNNLVNV